MALNFGLGFSFGARDAGLSKAINNLTSEFKGLGKEILGLSRIQTMLSALSFEKLDDLGEKLKNIGVGGLNLTSDLESTFTQYSKSVAKFGAQTGITGKDLAKLKQEASGMAYGLNMDIDSASKAIYGFKAAAGDLKGADILKGIGLESAQDYAKFAEQAGVDASNFSYELVTLGKEAHLSAQQVALITAQQIKFGQNANTLGKTLGSTKELMEILQTRTHLGDSAEDVAKFGQQVFSTADKLYAFTGDGEKAQAAAFELAKTLTDNKKSFADMMAGVEGASLSDFTKQVGIAGPGINAAFESMKQGPEAFLSSVATAVEGIKDEAQRDKAIEFFRAHMEKVFPQLSGMLVGGLKDVDARKKLMEQSALATATDAAKAGKEISKTYETGITAAEAFERQQKGLLQTLRGLSTVSTGDFLKETGKEMKKFGETLKDTAKQDGPLGSLVRGFADVQKFGVSGLLPANLRGEFSALGTAVEQATPVLAKFRAAGINLSSPMGALTAGIGLLGVKFLSYRKAAAAALEDTLKKQKKSKAEIAKIMSEKSSELTNTAIRQTATDVIDFFKNTLPKYAGIAVKFIAKFARKVLSGGFSTGASALTGDKATDDVLNELMKVLKDAFDGAMKFAKELFSGLWDGLMGKNIDPAKSTDAQAIGGAIGTALRAAFDFAKTELTNYLSGWWTNVTAIWSDPNKTFGDKLKETFGESIPLLIGGALLSTTALAGIATSLLSLAFNIVMGLSSALLKVGWKLIWESVKFLFNKIPWSRIGTWLMDTLWPILRQAFMSVFRSIGTFLVETLWPMVVTAFEAVVGFLSLPVVLVVAAITAAFVGLYYMLKEEGDSFSDTMSRMWAAIATTAEWYWDHIKEAAIFVFKNIGVALSNFWEATKYAFGMGVYYIQQAFVGVYNFVAGIFNKLVGVMVSPISTAIQTIGELLSKLGDAIAKSPKLASFFGIDADTQKAIKEAGSTMKGMTADALKAKASTALLPDAVKPTGPNFQGWAAKGEVESLASRQDKAFSAINKKKEERIAAEAAARAAEEAKKKAEASKTPPTTLPAGMGIPNMNAPAPGAADTVSAGTATSTASKLPVADFNDALLKATNNPEWVTNYIALINKHHAEMLVAIRESGNAAAPKPARTAPAPARVTAAATQPAAGPPIPPASVAPSR